MRATSSIGAFAIAGLVLGGTAVAQPTGDAGPPEASPAEPPSVPAPAPDTSRQPQPAPENAPPAEQEPLPDQGPPAGENPPTDAAPDDLSELTLEELLAVEIVSASNMKEQLSRAPGVVIRLSREDLEARGYREVLDIFDDLPGMDVIRPWGDNYLKVYWRGYRTDVTHPFLMMIDGMVINSLWTGDASVIAAMPISEIDHVEIVYGPASAVYGANAFMGVVNVITTAGLVEDNTQLRLRVTSGTYHARRLDQRIVDGIVVRRRGDLRFSVAGRVALNWTDADAGDRFEYTSRTYANDPALWGGYLAFDDLARGTHSPIDEYGLDARMNSGGLEVGAFALGLETGYGLVYPTDQAQPYAHWIQYERSAHVGYRAELSDRATAHSVFRLRESGIDNASYFLAGFNGTDFYETPDVRVTELSYWQARNRSATFFEDVEAQITDELTAQGGVKYERKELQGAYDVSLGPDLQPGDVRNENEDFTLPRPPPDDLASAERPLTDDYGAYAQVRWRREAVLLPGDAHALHLGIRYDYNSVFGDHHSPTLRVGYVGEHEGASGLLLGKLLYGEGFQEPNARQLYGGWQGSGSNVYLEPESSRTVELNASHTTERISNLISAYYVHNKDTITTFAGGAENKGKRSVFGIDYHFSALLRPAGFDSVSLWAYYSYIWSDERTFGAAGEEIYAPIGDLATHKVWLGGTARLRDRYTATLRGRAIGARDTVATNPIDEIDGFIVLDANARVERVGGWPMSVALQVDNLVGTHYAHPGVRTADSGDQPGHFEGAVWVGSAGFYNSVLPQPGRLVMLTVGLDL